MLSWHPFLVCFFEDPKLFLYLYFSVSLIEKENIRLTNHAGLLHGLTQIG
jgi:hypothetical protein